MERERELTGWWRYGRENRRAEKEKVNVILKGLTKL